MPKTDLHRHLSGSIQTSTLYELTRTTRPFRSPVAFESESQLDSLMSVLEPVETLAEFITPERGMRPWQILDQLYTSPEIVARIALEAGRDAHLDGVSHVEFRVSPYGMTKSSRIPLEGFIAGLRKGFAAARLEYGVECSIILSLARHTLVRYDPEDRRRYYSNLLEVASGFRGDPVVGFDLAGTEGEAPPAMFAEFFREAASLGFGITVHAGESEPASNIRDAIELLGAQRIGHGLTLLSDPSLMEVVRDTRILLEQSVTCNLRTSLVPSLELHPIKRLLEFGVRVAICTDNPSLLRLALSDEYLLVHKHLGVDKQMLSAMNSWAYESRFSYQPRSHTPE